MCPSGEPRILGLATPHGVLEHEALVEVEEDPEQVTHQEGGDEPDEDHCQVVLLPAPGLVPDGRAAAHALAASVLAKLDVLPDLGRRCNF